MKKILLLLSILCAGVLNGMEQPVPASTLPPDVIKIIMLYVHTYDNPDDIITAIKKLSLVDTNFNVIINDIYGNTEGFKALVHMISDKAGKSTEEIAKKFNTPTAKRYLNLAKQATKLFFDEDKVNQINLLIKDGLDVNFSYEWLHTKLLKEVIKYLEPDIIQAFLNAGAKVDKWDLKDMLEYIDAITATSPSLKAYKIKDLLRNAMKNPQ